MGAPEGVEGGEESGVTGGNLPSAKTFFIVAMLRDKDDLGTVPTFLFCHL